jgi:hypothetical protein
MVDCLEAEAEGLRKDRIEKVMFRRKDINATMKEVKGLFCRCWSCKLVGELLITINNRVVLPELITVQQSYLYFFYLITNPHAPNVIKARIGFRAP